MLKISRGKWGHLLQSNKNQAGTGAHLQHGMPSKFPKGVFNLEFPHPAEPSFELQGLGEFTSCKSFLGKRLGDVLQYVRE